MDIIIRKPAKKIAKRQQELRDRLWPGLNLKWLWQRKERSGFTTIPRCISLICAIIDDLTPGVPASSVYLDLWTRSFDENLVVLAKSREMAFHAGFVGQRAERTWKQRMKALGELGFIDLKEGPSGPLSYALIKNPYLVIKALKESGHQGVTAEKYNALVERCIDIGETSLDEVVPGDLEGVFPPPPPAAEVPAPPAVAPTPVTPDALIAPTPPLLPSTPPPLATEVAPVSGQAGLEAQKSLAAQSPTAASGIPAPSVARPQVPPPPPKPTI